MSKDHPGRLARLAPLAQSYRRALRGSEFIVAVALALAVCLGAALWARSGFVRDRTVARGLLAALLLVFVAALVWSRLRLARPDRILRRTVGLLDMEKADEVARADQLLDASLTGKGAGSPELILLHWERVVAALDTDAILRALRRRARIVMGLGLSLLLGSVVLSWGRIWEVVEGTNLLLAQGRVAPYLLPYVQKTRVIVRPPADVPGPAIAQSLWGETAILPVGSRVTVETELNVHGRNLVLTDGEHEIPLAPDGEGTWTADLTVEETLVLRIAARFGDSLIIDPFEKTIFAEPDIEPVVVLRGAPRSVPLRDVDHLALEYEVKDDRGISEIELVLESGRREERTMLSRPARGTLSEVGATELGADHPLLMGAYLPVKVRIEARDRALARRGSASASAAITIVPAALGASLVDRYRLLKSFRSRMVDYYAASRAAGFLAGGARKEAIAALTADLDVALKELERGLAKLPEGAAGSLGFLSAQVQALRRSGPEGLNPESAVLAVDVLLSELSTKDAERVAQDLAGALEEVKTMAQRSLDREKNQSSETLQDLSELLEGGARNLSELGVLGADLGSVAVADLGRMRICVGDRAWDRVARVAEHLAARLRRGSPSFGARGESPPNGPADVESGARPSPGTGSLSQAPEEFRALERETERLRKEHGAELSELERLLRDARLAAQSDAGGREDDLAEKLREAVSNLPEGASAPGSARAEAALGRGQAEAMADALEGLDMKRAVERGEAALGALERARDLGAQRGSSVLPESIDEAVLGVEDALRAARQAHEQKKDTLKTDESLRGNAERERRFAERARSLAKKGGSGSARLPEEAVRALERAASAMRRAADALEQGDAEDARSLAERAQTELERARGEDVSDAGQSSSTERGEASDSDESDDGDGQGREGTSEQGMVPKAEENLGRAFRERAQKGLRDRSGRIGPSVSRYLERLQ